MTAVEADLNSLYKCIFPCFRYEIFIDEVKPNDLSASVLREFMDLPTSYFAADAPIKYRKSP